MQLKCQRVSPSEFSRLRRCLVFRTAESPSSTSAIALNLQWLPGRRQAGHLARQKANSRFAMHLHELHEPLAKLSIPITMITRTTASLRVIPSIHASKTTPMFMNAPFVQNLIRIPKPISPPMSHSPRHVSLRPYPTTAPPRFTAQSTQRAPSMNPPPKRQRQHLSSPSIPSESNSRALVARYHPASAHVTQMTSSALRHQHLVRGRLRLARIATLH